MGSSRLIKAALATALATVLGTGASAAMAQQKTSGFYVGGGGGISGMQDLSKTCNNTLPAAGINVTTCDNRGVTWKGFAGYQFIRYFGLELGYYDFGKGTIKTANGGQADYKARGAYGGIVVTAPLTDSFSIIGRVGALRWSTKLNPDATSGITGASDNGIGTAFGLGVEYMFTDTFGVRGEWERFDRVGNDATTGETNINVYTISGLLRF
jgi:OOP family OmpA-OmpF porin